LQAPSSSKSCRSYEKSLESEDDIVIDTFVEVIVKSEQNVSWIPGPEKQAIGGGLRG